MYLTTILLLNREFDFTLFLITWAILFWRHAHIHASSLCACMPAYVVEIGGLWIKPNGKFCSAMKFERVCGARQWKKRENELLVLSYGFQCVDNMNGYMERAKETATPLERLSANRPYTSFSCLILLDLCMYKCSNNICIADTRQIS